jgi:hypothetical protein
LSTTITVGQQPIPLTLTGIVNAVYLSLRTTSLPSGSGTAILDVNAEDASGNIIVGPGNYNVPISVAASDPSVALSATTVSGPNQPITVTVAKPTEVRFTANASGLSGNAFTPAVLTAGSYSVVFVGENSKNAILEFPSTASFPLVPLHQISESQDIEQIAANASGELAVALADGTVQLFNPGSVTPSMTVTTGLYAQGLALDASGNWYILGTVNGNYEIATYPQGSSSPTNIISGPATGIVSPGLYDLAVDGSDTLYELDGYGTLSVNEWTAGHQNGNVAPTSVATIPGNFGGGGIAAEANGSLAVIAYANTVFGQATINFFAPGATTPSSSWSPVGNADAIAYGQNGDLFIGGTGATVGVLAAGTNPSGAGYSRSFGPPGGDGFAQPLAVGGSGTPTAPAVTTVSGDFIAPAASKTWNYAALPATGVPYTVSVYSDPSPDTGGNIALVGFDYGSVVPDAAAAGGYVVGAIGLSAASGGGYIAKTFGSVTNDTYGPVPGTPILIPGSVTLGQSFTPYPGVTETVTGVGAVAGMSACPGSPTTGAVVAYTLGHISESISFVPGCGITDLVTDNGTEFRLTSITQDPQLGQQSVARATRNATTLDLLRSMWKRVFRPWVKL